MLFLMEGRAAVGPRGRTRGNDKRPLRGSVSDVAGVRAMQFDPKLQNAKRAVLILTLLTLCAGPALGQKVGTAAAVNPDSTGMPPGGSVRTLKIGADVVHNERI